MDFLSPSFPAEPPGLDTELPQTMAVDDAGEILLLDTPRAPKPLLGLGCAWLLDDPVNVEVMDQERLGCPGHATCRAWCMAYRLTVWCSSLMLVLPSTQAPRWEQTRAGLSACAAA